MKRKIISYAAIIAGLLIISYAFVPQVLSGQIVNQSDISGWQGMSHEMMEWNSAHPSDQTAWTQSMFGGMPTATIHASTRGDWTQAIYDLLLLGRRPATYLFISLLGAWLMLLSLGVHPLIAAGGAIATTFCAYNPQIIQVGHNTKMQAIAFLPWVLAALIFSYRSIFRKRKWLAASAFGAAAFALTLSFQVKANHPQITYYLALLILIFVVVELIWIIKDKTRRIHLRRFFATSALLLLLGSVGIATNAIKLLPTYEYTPYSIRGGSTAAADGSKATKGLDLDYATAWSYGWEELPNLLIPNFNGGSSAGAVDPKHSATYDLLKSAGQTNLREVSKQLPLYWGPQPFTAGPMYMGAVSIFLFLLGLLVYRGKERWWLLAATLLAVFLALGSHFMWFTRLFYDYAPFYNKFRTVSMALVVLQVTIPLLAFLTLDRIVRTDVSSSDGPIRAQTLRRKTIIAAAISGGFCLLCALFTGIAGSFTSAADAGQSEVLVDALITDRIHLLRCDAWRSAALIAFSAGLLIWAITPPKSAPKTYATQAQFRHSRRRTAAMLVCVLVAIDLIPVAKRYLNSDDFTSPKKFQSQFALRPVDKMILEDPDPSYRVLDLSVNIFNDSHPSYWHKSIGGYSPAKLQRYQEFIDSQLSGEINTLYKSLSSAGTIAEAEAALPYLEGLAKMNCRYIIIGDDLPPLRYKYAAGNAWFERNTDAAGSLNISDSGSLIESGSGNLGNASSKASGSEEAGSTALDISSASQPELAAADDQILMTSYAPNCQVYQYSSATGGKLVFSEVYYPVGWTLTLDAVESSDAHNADSSIPAGSRTELEGSAKEASAQSKASPQVIPIELEGKLWRSAIVPAGTHTLTMRFDPPSYRIGETASRLCSIAILLVFLGASAAFVFSRKEKPNASTPV